jgi:hypothetical protein
MPLFQRGFVTTDTRTPEQLAADINKVNLAAAAKAPKSPVKNFIKAVIAPKPAPAKPAPAKAAPVKPQKHK